MSVESKSSRPNGRFWVGQIVTVLQEPFKGIEAEIVQVLEAERQAVVRLKIWGRAVTATFEWDALRPRAE